MIEKRRLVVNLLQKKQCAAEKKHIINKFTVEKEKMRGKLSAKRSILRGKKSVFATDCDKKRKT